MNKSLFFVVILAIAQSMSMHAASESNKFVALIARYTMYTVATVGAAHFLFQASEPTEVKPFIEVSPEAKKAVCDLTNITCDLACGLAKVVIAAKK